MPADDLDRFERQAEGHRRALSDTLGQIGEALSPEQLAHKAQGYAAEMGQQAWDTARQNPAALALTGAGVALLLTGLARRDADTAPAPAAQPAPRVPQPSRAAALRRRVSHGLDRLPDGARRRVIAAREAAIDAQDAVERKAHQTVPASHKMMHRQPVLAGAAAFGLGALAAAVLPNSRVEDRTLGKRRDALMARADRVLAQELSKLRRDIAKR